MSDFLEFLYAGYIKPYVDAQPRDDGDIFRQDLLNNELTWEQRLEDLEPVLRFAAVHGFLLGLRTGEGLSSPAQ